MRYLRFLLVVILTISLSGCVYGRPEINWDGPYVLVRSGVRDGDTWSATVYEGDVVIFRAPGDDREDRRLPMRAGSFREILRHTKEMIPRVREEVSSTQSFDCEAPVSDSIQYGDWLGTVSVLPTYCPHPSLDAAMAELRRMINDALV